MKTLLLTGFFFFMLLTGLQAQDKYDYAIVCYRAEYKLVEVCINGENYERVEVKAPIDVYFIDLAGLKQVKKMNNEGWELFDTQASAYGDTGVTVYIYYLRRKVD